MNCHFLLRALALLLFVQSCTIWPMKPKSNASPENQEIQTIIQQVKDQIAAQPQIDAAQLVAQIKEQMGQGDTTHKASWSDVIQALDQSVKDYQRKPFGNQPKTAEAKGVYEKFLSVLSFAKSGDAASLDKERQKIMNQNTVLLGHPKFPIALYKRDLQALPFMAFDVGIAYALFRTYKQRYIDHIYKTMTKDIDTFVALFTEIENEDKNFANKNSSRQKKINVLAKALKLEKQITESLQYIGSNPFKVDIFVPLLATLAGHRASAYLRKKVMTVNSVMPEAFNAYTKNNDGTYNRFLLDPMYGEDITSDGIKLFSSGKNLGEKLIDSMAPKPIVHRFDGGKLVRVNAPTDVKTVTVDDAKQAASSLFSTILSCFFFNRAPMSVARALGYSVNNPNMVLTADYAPDPQSLKPAVVALDRGINRLVGIPNWLYTVSNSPITHAAIEGVVLWQVLKLIETLYSSSFIKAAVWQNRDELITLLRAYQKVQHAPNTNKDKQHAGEQLKKFITKHTVMPSWRTACKELYAFMFKSRSNVQERIAAWAYVTVISCLLWKGRSLIKFGYSAVKNNMVSPYVGWIGGMYLLEIISPLMVTLPKVCQDIWWMGKKVINFIKKKTRKSNKTVPIGGSI